MATSQKLNATSDFAPPLSLYELRSLLIANSAYNDKKE
nr:MAG TPA: hypothetical protein [Caudoviricetes sp.]